MFGEKTEFRRQKVTNIAFTGEGWSNRSARCPTFDSEMSTFLWWWTKFQTYAIACAFQEALTDDREIKEGGMA